MSTTIFYIYDGTLAGLLTAVFESFDRKEANVTIICEGEPLPLFAINSHTVITQDEKAERVWTGLEKRVSQVSCKLIWYAALFEGPGNGQFIFDYLCRIFRSKKHFEMDFGDPDTLRMQQIARKVGHEQQYMRQFIRFQKCRDEIFFAPVAPESNVLPLNAEYFRDRFGDQKWIIYDTRRHYGFFYDLKQVQEITLDDEKLEAEGKLRNDILAEEEILFQDMWRGYFSSITIRERINPKLHKKNMPKRFWKYLTEKQ